MLALRRSTSLVGRVVLNTKLVRPLPGRINLSTTSPLMQKKQSDSKDEKPQSILNDDILSKAGFDLEDPKELHQQKSQEGETESNKGAAGASESGRGDDKKKRRKRQTSTDIKREKYANWFYISTFASMAGVGLYMTRDWDETDSQEVRQGVDNGYTPELMYQRFMTRVHNMFSYFQEPPFPDLLPPPPPPPYQRPLTLVITLEDLLVHSEWSQQYGWRTAKRPGCDYFLGYLSQYYEIVLFSSNYMMYSDRICEKLDPVHAFISYNLFKEHCVYKDGIHIKDLSKMNRDVGKVVMIDTDPNSYKLQPENAIPAKPWDGKPDDGLLQLIPFLEYLATQQVNDVRPVLSSFQDKTKIPVEFAQRVDKLKSKFFTEHRAKSEGNWALKMLGVAPSSSSVKFPLDLIREEGEKNYIRFMQLIEEEKEKIRLQQEQLGGQTFTLKDYVEGNIPSPEEQVKIQLEKQQEVEQLFEQRKKEKVEQKKQQKQQQQN